MKILVDSYELNNKNYNLMKTLVYNLKNNDKCELSLLCRDEQIKNELLNSNEFFDFDIKMFNDNLEKYDFFISALNDKPDCIAKYSNITSIAILLDLIHRV